MGRAERRGGPQEQVAAQAPEPVDEDHTRAADRVGQERVEEGVDRRRLPLAGPADQVQVDVERLERHAERRVRAREEPQLDGAHASAPIARIIRSWYCWRRSASNDSRSRSSATPASSARRAAYHAWTASNVSAPARGALAVVADEPLELLRPPLHDLRGHVVTEEPRDVFVEGRTGEAVAHLRGVERVQQLARRPRVVAALLLGRLTLPAGSGLPLLALPLGPQPAFLLVAPGLYGPLFRELGGEARQFHGRPAGDEQEPEGAEGGHGRVTGR